MTREEYEKLYDTEPDSIDFTDVDVIEWLDNIVEALKRLNECRYDLYYGKLDREKGEYEKHIKLCSNDAPQLHVYDGINTLAEVVKCELRVIKNNSENYPYRYWFIYKGMMVYQLERQPLEGVVSK